MRLAKPVLEVSAGGWDAAPGCRESLLLTPTSARLLLLATRWMDVPLGLSNHPNGCLEGRQLQRSYGPVLTSCRKSSSRATIAAARPSDPLSGSRDTSTMGGIISGASQRHKNVELLLSQWNPIMSDTLPHFHE